MPLRTGGSSRTHAGKAPDDLGGVQIRHGPDGRWYPFTRSGRASGRPRRITSGGRGIRRCDAGQESPLSTTIGSRRRSEEWGKGRPERALSSKHQNNYD